MNAKDENGNTALMRALRNRYIKTAKILLAKGADVNAKNNDGNTALMLASTRGKTKTTEMLLAKGADVNAKNNEGKTALMIAKEEDHAQIIQAFEKHKVRQDTIARAKAEAKEKAEVARKKDKEKKAIVTQKQAEEKTAKSQQNKGSKNCLICLAAQKGSLEMVNILLKAGHDPTQADKGGKTASDYAIEGEHIKILEALEKAKTEQKKN